MIQFNLLPDVKLEYIRAQRLKRSVVGIAALAAGISFTILVLLVLVVDVFQKQHLRGLNNDVKTDITKLQSIHDLNKVLTIQNQINSLPALHDKKPVASRLFGYIQQIVPDKVSISALSISFEQNTLVFTGTADKLSTINKFVDTLKFTTFGIGSVRGDWINGNSYKVNDVVNHNGTSYACTVDNTADQTTEPGVGADWKTHWHEAPAAFSNVVLSSFGRSDKGASYSINVVFNKDIFDSSKAVKLIVPEIITTRSKTEQPSELFVAPTAQPDTNNNQTSQ